MKPFYGIIGAGNIGTALALLLARRGHAIRMYCIEPDVEEDISTRHVNSKYLAGVSLPKHIQASHSLEECVHGAKLIILAVPSFALSDMCRQLAPLLSKETIVAIITKGIDESSGQPMGIAAAHLLPAHIRSRICIMAGPAVANELIQQTPTGLLFAGKNKAALNTMQQLFASETIKVPLSHDLRGVGYAMALKNVYAIALGMCDGLQYPMNSKALVYTLAVHEMRVILDAANARPETVISLAGLGDLLVTGFSPHGRNRTYGERLIGARTRDPKALQLTTVEGLATIKPAQKLARSLHCATPLLDAIAKCLSKAHDFEEPFITYLKRVRFPTL